jgi:hypothetical protein
MGSIATGPMARTTVCMPSNPVVSIVMAARNAAMHLQETMEGVLSQTFDSWELVAIDDGSSDDTGEILARYASLDSRIKVIRRSHRGLAASLNFGIAVAVGDYIARLDADDVPMPHRIATQVSWLNDHPEFAVVGSTALYLSDQGRTNTLKAVPTDHLSIRRLLLRGNCLIHPTVMMRKATFLAVGGYRECFSAAQDYDLWLRMIEHGSIANIAEPLIYYRIHNEQATVRKLQQQVWGTLAAQHSAIRRREGCADPLDAAVEINDLIIEHLGLSDSTASAMVAAFEDRVATHLLVSQRSQALLYADSFRATADRQQWSKLFRPRLHLQLVVDALRHGNVLDAGHYAALAIWSQPSLILRLPVRLLEEVFFAVEK